MYEVGADSLRVNSELGQEPGRDSAVIANDSQEKMLGLDRVGPQAQPHTVGPKKDVPGPGSERHLPGPRITTRTNQLRYIPPRIRDRHPIGP